MTATTQTVNETIWIMGDQLWPEHPLLDKKRQAEQVVLMVESLGRYTTFPYQKKKVVLVLSAMRHYAAALQKAGWRVDYRQADTFADGLGQHLKEYQPGKLVTVQAAEYAARQAQKRLAYELNIEFEITPSRQFLVEQHPALAKSEQKMIMETFYRAMRKHYGVLIEPNGQPTGGNWNYDAENRKPYKGDKTPPLPLSFEPDRITREVMELVDEKCVNNIGTTDGFDLGVTRQQALEALDDFILNRLPDFGPYEDAMSNTQPILWHSLLSPYMNIGLLEPLEMVQRAEQAFRQNHAPLNSVEGFIRQILGWREYMYWQYHRMMPDLHSANSWEATQDLPDFFWTGQTDMNCLNHALNHLLATGYTHHIQRLMVICNFATLAGIKPNQVNDWFLACYFDAYDWVVTPNVIGMGMCADGGIIGTKPYVASAAYINKMSDHCKPCRYNPKERTGPDACPYNFLYWNVILKWEDRLRHNPRFGPNVLGLKYLDKDEREKAQSRAAAFLDSDVMTPSKGSRILERGRIKALAAATKVK